MTPQKTPFNARLNLFWANMLTPINAYLGTALILLALVMAMIGLTGGHMGGHVYNSVMRDGGDVSVWVQEGLMQDDRMPENRMEPGQEYHNWHPDWRHPDWRHHGYEHHGWHMGGGHHGERGAGLFGLVLAVGLAGLVGLVAQLIRIEGHLAALRYGMEDSSAAAYAPLALIFYPHTHKKSRAEALLFSSPPLEN